MVRGRRVRQVPSQTRRPGHLPISNALTMYLRFTPIAPFPLASAVLTLSFTDLDLSGVNDPSGFTETIPFFSATNSALTSVITTAPGSGSSPLAYTVTGNSTNQTIFGRPFHHPNGPVLSEAGLRFERNVFREFYQYDGIVDRDTHNFDGGCSRTDFDVAPWKRTDCAGRVAASSKINRLSHRPTAGGHVTIHEGDSRSCPSFFWGASHY